MRLVSLMIGLFGTGLVVNALDGPFLEEIDSSTWIFGNSLWNVTQNAVYAKPAYYLGTEIVGDAYGHYMGYGWSGHQSPATQAAQM
jgi:rhamnogalacturonan endolyase